jgi:protein-S-isoprenylcysteine O-methyltransferase Ste14
MGLNVHAAVGYTWMLLALVWLIGLAFTKRTVRSQQFGPRLFHGLVIILGFTLVCGTQLRAGWLGARLFPPSPAADLAGIVLTALGCLFAIWARIQLGSNWSGRATVKANHELIVTGPYAVSRHPIYSGLLLASLGTAIAYGEAGAVLGLVLIFLGFTVKMSQEERLMLDTFPQAYPDYRRRVKALIPGVF